MKDPIKKPKKKFDAVKMMRDIRDKMSRDMMNMTREEQRAYIDDILAKRPAKKAA